MASRELETGLAWLSLAGAVLHFSLETLYHLRFGQFLPLLLIDYVAVGLLAGSGLVSLRVRPASASGLLSGAWGFAASLAYLGFFTHLQLYLQGAAPLFVVIVLGAALAAAWGAFACSLLLAWTTMRRSTTR